MDPIAHTLVGAALAKSGFERRCRFAAAALVVGANLPDVDGITYLVSGDLGLSFRRGWTHGIPAVVVWPFLLAGALVLLDRLLGSRAARFGALLPLSFLAVATHPTLDWLNNYGLRWLMPFDGTWFYGDALFIVDPWMWLVLGGAVFLATARRRGLMLAWGAGALLATLLVLRGAPGLVAGKALFLVGLGTFATLKWLRIPGTEARLERLNRGALAAVGIYVVAMVVLSRSAHRATVAELTRRAVAPESVMVGPTPMNPFRRDVVVATESSYRYGTLSLWPSFQLTLAPTAIPRRQSTAVVARALEAPQVRGFANWARFPWAEVEERPEGYVVYLGDARYSRGRGEGFGSAVVFVPREGPTATPSR
jgi:inner membrane protein